MSTFDFYICDTTDFTTDFKIEEYFTTPEHSSPSFSLFDDWFNTIPVHNTTPTPEPPSSPSSSSTPEDSINESPITTSPPTSLPQEEDTPKPTFSYEPLNEVINWYETRLHHKSLAHYSTLNRSAPKTLKERWEMYDDMDSNEVYRVIYYQGHFLGWHLLTKWQEKFMRDIARVAPTPCMFCELPPGVTWWQKNCNYYFVFSSCFQINVQFYLNFL